MDRVQRLSRAKRRARRALLRSAGPVLSARASKRRGETARKGPRSSTGRGNGTAGGFSGQLLYPRRIATLGGSQKNAANAT